MIDNPILSFVVFSIASTILFSQVVSVGLLFLYIAIRLGGIKNKTALNISHLLSDLSLPLTFLVATGATLGSLFLSEVAKLPPCELCWFQRIFMYPQMVILAVAFWRNDKSVFLYTLPLSVIGLAIALYHYLLQLYPTILPCSDEVANCSLKQIQYFGYMTIPMMSGTAFLLLILLTLFGMRKERK